MKKILLSIAFGFIALTIITAQETKSYQIIQKSEKGVPSFIRFDANNDVTHENFFEKMKDEFGFNVDDKFVLEESVKDEIGFTFYKYTQQYKGLPVNGAEFIIHEKNGIATSANGKFIPKLDINIAPAISKDDAVNTAKSELNLGKYRWEDAVAENILKRKTKNANATYYPIPELVIEPVNGNYKTGAFRLCWKFNVLGATLDKAYTVFIDAQNGILVNQFSLINDADAACTAATLYNSTQNITCAYDGTSYSLYQDQTRGPSNTQVITVFNANHDSLASQSNGIGNVANTAQEIISPSSNFTSDPIATNIYWAMEKTYDFYYNIFGRNSYNNNGSEIVNLAHYGVEMGPGAFWSNSDSVMAYWDGDGLNFRPFVTLDIVAHELTHAIVSRTSKLEYKGESGALNETFCDIMGTGVEYYAVGSNFNWTIMENILITPGINHSYTRSMSNPKDSAYRFVSGNLVLMQSAQPNTYEGEYWRNTDSTATDRGGVHRNSGVGNYWFYLLSEGGSGVNDNVDIYFVTGIGIDNALTITYRAFTAGYITSTAAYSDAMLGTIQAAIDLYGANSSKVQSVKDAWCAVGLDCNSVGIKETNNELTASIYPNPANNMITIVSDGKPMLVSLYDITGREIISTQMSGSRNTLDISKVSKGLYVVQIQEDGKNYQQKIVVQ